MASVETPDRTALKLLAAVLLIISGLGWTFYRVNKVRPGAVANNGVTEEFSLPSPEELDKIRRQMYAYANVTPEQQARLEALQKKAQQLWQQRQAETTGPQQRVLGGVGPWGAPGGGPGMALRLPRELQPEIDKILTADQQAKMREFLRDRFRAERAKREAKVKAALGEAEYQRYLEKRRERFASRGFGGGPRSRPPETTPQNPVPASDQQPPSGGNR